MKRIVIDLDDTLSITVDGAYESASVIAEVRDRLIEYKDKGYEIVIHSARNMRTYEGRIGKINAITLPKIISWLDTNGVPFDEIIVGKPWCGFDGFYVDDKAIRPDEFVNLDEDAIRRLLDDAAERLRAGRRG